jgi:uncharacterized protein (TIGR02266 family)
MSAERHAANVRVGTEALRRSEPRRGERRDRVRCEVQIDIDVRSGSKTYAGVTRDLSEAGVFIATELNLGVGSTVELRVHLSATAEPVRCLGEVRWRRAPGAESGAPAGVGLRFVVLDADSLRAIQAFLLDRAPLDVEE